MGLTGGLIRPVQRFQDEAGDAAVMVPYRRRLPRACATVVLAQRVVGSENLRHALNPWVCSITLTGHAVHDARSVELA